MMMSWMTTAVLLCPAAPAGVARDAIGQIMLHYQFYYNININRLFEGVHPLEVAWAGYFTLNFMCAPRCSKRLLSSSQLVAGT